ncbi:aminodeoxychorismate lyase [Psychrosphaera sp.]|nr:aminodeoxychorismate lyase [Psychrosphaera sp.]
MAFNSYDNNLLPTDLEGTWQQQRSFLFGDGHFTTAKVEQGKVVWLPAHIKRLEQANEILKFGRVNWSSLTELMISKAKVINEGILKVQLSRGQSVRGYQISDNMTPCVFIYEMPQQLPATKTLKQPIELAILNTQIGLNPQLAGVKHCNRIEQSLIAHELKERSIADGLVTNIEGHVIESSKANVFWFDGANWHTPKLNLSGINGVAKNVIENHIPNLKNTDTNTESLLLNAKSMFVCNSIAGIIPVATLNGKTLNTALVTELHKKVFNE